MQKIPNTIEQIHIEELCEEETGEAVKRRKVTVRCEKEMEDVRCHLETKGVLSRHWSAHVVRWRRQVENRKERNEIQRS
eukprot:767078-Hanusia_phi.AAC.3